MSNRRQDELRNLTDIVSSLEEKLLHLTLDLEAAKTSLSVLKQEEERSPKSNPSDAFTRPRRSKRDKVITSINSQPSIQSNKRIFKVGNRIRVLNPNKRQTITTGLVTGYTRNGYVQFTLDDGTITCRAPHNLAFSS